MVETSVTIYNSTSQDFTHQYGSIKINCNTVTLCECETYLTTKHRNNKKEFSDYQMRSFVSDA